MRRVSNHCCKIDAPCINRIHFLYVHSHKHKYIKIWGGRGRVGVCVRVRVCICVCVHKKLDGNYTRMLIAILKKSWEQQPTKQQLYVHRLPITKTIKIRRTRHAGYCWKSTDELISDVLLWTPSQGRAKAGRPAQTYIQKLCADTGCSPEDLPGAMDDSEGW